MITPAVRSIFSAPKCATSSPGGGRCLKIGTESSPTDEGVSTPEEDSPTVVHLKIDGASHSPRHVFHAAHKMAARATTARMITGMGRSTLAWSFRRGLHRLEGGERVDLMA